LINIFRHKMPSKNKMAADLTAMSADRHQMATEAIEYAYQ